MGENFYVKTKKILLTLYILRIYNENEYIKKVGLHCDFFPYF